MAYTGNSSKAVSSSFLYSTLQTFYTKIKGLLDNKADKTALNSINPNAINGGYTKNSFYINTHPENSGAIIPFINNDIAFLLKRGGSAKIYYDDVVQSADISNVFDGSPSYWAIDPTDVTKVVIELTLHKTFTWTNTVYVDFGSAGWRAKSVSIDVMNTGNSETTWTNKSTITNNSIGEHKVTFSHNDGKGFNKIRFTFTDWAHTTIFRISCLGVVNYGSSGLRETFLPKDGGSVYGAITPYSNNSIDLGSSSLKWKNIYATTFNGSLSGNASTATKATKDSADQQINTTYIKGLSVSGKTITYTKGDNTTGTITTQDTNTTYSAGTGISLSGTTFSNSGVRSIASGSTNGTISVNTNGTSKDIAVKGLGSAAYTASTAYATSGHTHNYAGSSSAGGVATDADKLDGYHGDNYLLAYNNYGAGYFGSYDLNTWTRTGCYAIQSGCTNSPVGSSDAWGTVFVMKGLSDRISQFAIMWNEPGNPLWQRSLNSSSWSNWYRIYGSQNITYGTSALTPGSSGLATGNIYLQYE